MTGYVLSPAAQADRYVLGIRDACAALAEGSKTGQPIDAIRPGYRKLAVASRFLFYRITETGLIDVVRIFHQRMDMAVHL